MGRKKLRLEDKIDSAIRKIGIKSIKRSEKNVVCVKCGDKIEIKEDKIGCRIRDHLKGKKHIDAIKTSEVVQLMPAVISNLGRKNQKEEEFRSKLLDAFTAANIPINKLLNPRFRSFIQYLIKSQPMEISVPHPRTLRRNLKDKYLKIRNEIAKTVRDKDVYFMIDETPDAESRNVVNVLVGLLDGNESKSMLINVAFPDHINNQSVQEIVLETCAILWKGNIYPHLKLIVSDQAAYMLLAVRLLKQSVSFPNLKHVTCIIHALHLVCNSIRNEFPLVDRFFSKEKKFFKNSGKKKRLFKSSTGLKLIPSPILIRWGSWLKCVNYHLEDSNFEKISQFFLETAGNDDAECSKNLRQILTNTRKDRS